MQRSSIAFSLFVALFFVFATGCSKSPEQRLTGTWAIDVEATLDAKAATLEGEELEEFEAEREEAVENLSAMSMTMTFNADGTASMTMTFLEETTEAGTWEITSAEGDEIVVAMTKEGDEEAEENTFTFSGNDQFSIEMMNDALVFTRQ